MLSATKIPSASTLRFLFEMVLSAPIGLLALDRKGKILLFNERAKTNLGLPAQSEWLGKSVFDFEDFEGRFHEYFKKFLAGELQAYELLEVEINGRYITVRAWLAKEGLMVALNDVTRFKEMEAESLRANIQGQENERSRLAKEIHDGIGPLLSTTNLYLESLLPDIQKCSPEAKKRYDSIAGLLNMLSREIRNISRALMPIAVEDFGLVSALEDMVEKARGIAGIQVHLFTSGMKSRLSHESELGLYRIVQELLNNTLKYAKAQSVNIQLIRHPESIVLTYEDDGKGFNYDGSLSTGGFGLRDIQARVKSLGGSFTLDTSRGRGVVATVELPVNE
jgi:PAS domain S-box-containing protein